MDTAMQVKATSTTTLSQENVDHCITKAVAEMQTNFTAKRPVCKPAEGRGNVCEECPPPSYYHSSHCGCLKRGQCTCKPGFYCCPVMCGYAGPMYNGYTCRKPIQKKCTSGKGKGQGQGQGKEKGNGKRKGKGKHGNGNQGHGHGKQGNRHGKQGHSKAGKKYSNYEKRG